MTGLDAFQKVALASFDVHCTACGDDTDCLVFWRDETDTSREPDAALCLGCLLTADGQYKQRPPEQLVRKCETIQSVRERDDAVVITAESSLGVVQYLHHTGKTIDVVRQTEEPKVRVLFKRERTLTGDVEAFTGSGEFLAAVSPYDDIAADHLSS